MKIIKLDAIDSTNSFLKEMAQKMDLENFTVVTAASQKKGRGQMGEEWVSEPSKNLLCSVFVAFDALKITEKRLLNYAVSIAVLNVLKEYEVPKLQVKWPNDIMSDHDKICGILIENVMQKKHIKSTVIGLGVNINQLDFPNSLSKVTSVKRTTKKEVNIEEFLNKLIQELKGTLKIVSSKDRTILESTYLSLLYKKNIPSMFKETDNTLFMGKIIGISSVGKLQIQLDNELIKEFEVKEVSFA